MNTKVLQKYRFCVVRFVRWGSTESSRASPVVDSIIRVDHAGELGADRIYAGQMAVLGNTKVGPIIQHMWDQEKVHKETFEKLIVKYRVRPTVMTPIWNVAGFLLGAGTALMGEKAAMACTVAVESVIVDHYNDQLRVLMAEPEKNKELLRTIQKFRDEEQEHHDSGLDHGAEQAPFYKGLTEVIKFGCKTAIAISKDLFAKQKIYHPGRRTYSTMDIPERAEETPRSESEWHLYGGVCLERKPLLLKDFNSFEKKYYDNLQRLEFLKSYKSDHEVRKEEDVERIKRIKTDAFLSKKELELLSRKTAQEFEDSCLQELKEFEKAPRITAADENNDFKSPNRKLDSNLVLLVSSSAENWRLPDCEWKEGETLRETAERLLKNIFGTSLKAHFIGNAPCGFYKFKYSRKERKNGIGKKIFFFRAFYESGNIHLNENSGLDYRWATFPELETLVKRKKYLKELKMFMIDDSRSLEGDN